MEIKQIYMKNNEIITEYINLKDVLVNAYEIDLEENTIWHTNSCAKNYLDYRDRIPEFCPHCNSEFRFVHQCFIPKQPERLRRVDTNNSEAIVRSANINKIAEVGRNDQPSQ